VCHGSDNVDFEPHILDVWGCAGDPNAEKLIIQLQPGILPAQRHGDSTPQRSHWGLSNDINLQDGPYTTIKTTNINHSLEKAVTHHECSEKLPTGISWDRS
jgi:hypothetical protein